MNQPRINLIGKKNQKMQEMAANYTAKDHTRSHQKKKK